MEARLQPSQGCASTPRAGKPTSQGGCAEVSALGDARRSFLRPGETRYAAPATPGARAWERVRPRVLLSVVDRAARLPENEFCCGALRAEPASERSARQSAVAEPSGGEAGDASHARRTTRCWFRHLCVVGHMRVALSRSMDAVEASPGLSRRRRAGVTRRVGWPVRARRRRSRRRTARATDVTTVAGASSGRQAHCRRMVALDGVCAHWQPTSPRSSRRRRSALFGTTTIESRDGDATRTLDERRGRTPRGAERSPPRRRGAPLWGRSGAPL